MSSELVHLEALAVELSRAGLVCRLFQRDPPVRLRVMWVAVPVVGETVTVVPFPGSNGDRLWFKCSLGTLLAPCSQVADAAMLVLDWMERIVPRDAVAGR